MSIENYLSDEDTTILGKAKQILAKQAYCAICYKANLCHKCGKELINDKVLGNRNYCPSCGNDNDKE